MEASPSKKTLEIQEEISKNKARKENNYNKTLENKKKKRKFEKEKQREKYKTYRQEGGTSKSDIRLLQFDRLKESMISGIKVCIDMQFENVMTDKELNHLANQLKRVYSSNKASQTPFHLSFCNMKRNGKAFQMCCKKNTGFADYQLTFEEKSVSDSYSLSNIIYLSPDSDNVLQSIDSDKVYVIGGLVDESVKKKTTYDFSNQQNMNTARLPITEFMSKTSSGSFKQILTINQVFDILLNYYETSDWKSALSKNIPLRTGFVLKDNTF